MTALYALPTLAVIALLASRRVSGIAAGVVGLAATVPLAVTALPEGTAAGAWLAVEAARAAWLAWQAIAVILAGMLFHQITLAGERRRAEGGPADYSHRRLFALCFLLGPFFESAVGFGLGVVILVPLLLRLGLAPVWAAVFALYSQTMVPWGAMAIGSTVGAGLAGLPPAALGTASVFVLAPVLLGCLGVFWVLAARSGAGPTRGAMLDDGVWLAAICAGLYLGNRFIALEAGVLVACGALLPLRFLRDERPDAAAWRGLAPRAAPYLALTLLVLLTRAVEPLAQWLEAVSTLRPFADQLGFALLHHVSVLILLVAIANAAAHRLGLRRLLTAGAAAWRAAWRPALVTLIFVIMGGLTGASGMAAAMTRALLAAAGDAAVLASPVIAAVAGFLTGSNAASNAIMMPLQAQIADQTGQPLTALAALQNTGGSFFTMFSPIRVAMATALLGIAGQEGMVYQRAWPVGATALAILLAIAAGVVLFA